MDENFATRRKLYGDETLGRKNLQMVDICQKYGAHCKFPGNFKPDFPILIVFLLVPLQQRHFYYLKLLLMDLKIIYHNIYLPTQQGQIMFCQKIGKNSIAKKKLIIFFTIHFLQKKNVAILFAIQFLKFLHDVAPNNIFVQLGNVSEQQNVQNIF